MSSHKERANETPKALAVSSERSLQKNTPYDYDNCFPDSPLIFSFLCVWIVTDRGELEVDRGLFGLRRKVVENILPRKPAVLYFGYGGKAGEFPGLRKSVTVNYNAAGFFRAKV